MFNKFLFNEPQSNDEDQDENTIETKSLSKQWLYEFSQPTDENEEEVKGACACL